MRVIRNVELDLRRFRSRVMVITVFILAGFLLLALRLFYLQIIRYDELNEKAESNSDSLNGAQTRIANEQFALAA